MKITIQKDQWFSLNSEYELTNVELNTSKFKVPSSNSSSSSRKDVIFIRIGKKLNYFPKASSSYNSHHLPPVIKMCQLGRIFLQSITIDILESICWNDKNVLI